MTQLEDVARSCCQGLGMLQDWHKLRVGCSSPCHKRPGAVSSPFFKIFYLFSSLVVSLQHTECHHLHEFDTPMSSFFVLSPTCFLSVRLFLSLFPPLFMSVVSLPRSLPLTPSFFSHCASPLSADGGGAIHANYGSRAGGSLQVVED